MIEKIHRIIVPLYVKDRADNAVYLLNHGQARLLLIAGQEQWSMLQQEAENFPLVKWIISLRSIPNPEDSRILCIDQCLPGDAELRLQSGESGADELATIVYTSGTTGKPKGVMLSHQNILANAEAGLGAVCIDENDLFLSFLPLSHMLERTAGYYLPMMAGSIVAYVRSTHELAEDLQTLRPTVLISVPLIYERIFGQIRDHLSQQPIAVRWFFHRAVQVGWRRFLCRGGVYPRLPLVPAETATARPGSRWRRFLCSGGVYPRLLWIMRRSPRMLVSFASGPPRSGA